MRRKSRSKLVESYAEKLPGTVLDVFWKQFKKLIHHKSGIYVLYKNDVPHYVGKASNLSYRVRAHQNDRLRGKREAFSFYVVRRASHIKHLESLLLRIIEPQGAWASGKLPGAQNLRREFLEGLQPFARALKELKKKR
jgi:hypothetical protein